MNTATEVKEAVKHEVIINILYPDEKTLRVETVFSIEELKVAAIAIQNSMMNTDEGWNDEKVIQGLERNGYIKVLGPGPLFLDISTL